MVFVLRELANVMSRRSKAYRGRESFDGVQGRDHESALYSTPLGGREWNDMVGVKIK